jgi:hypothetical protein
MWPQLPLALPLAHYVWLTEQCKIFVARDPQAGLSSIAKDYRFFVRVTAVLPFLGLGGNATLPFGAHENHPWLIIAPNASEKARPPRIVD